MSQNEEKYIANILRSYYGLEANEKKKGFANK
jgi:hypothetical protein